MAELARSTEAHQQREQWGFLRRRYECDFDNGITNSGITGSVVLKQRGPLSPLVIEGEVDGLTDGFHGFHIHEATELPPDNCAATLGHFNPFNTFHGGSTSTDLTEISGERHTGDLGNIFSVGGKADVLFIERRESTDPGRADVRGRVIVIHAEPDQFTQSGDNLKNAEQYLLTPSDLTHTGRAGARVACCVIVEA
eukprot:jgi/Bigna1/36072/e_gw1.12.114.1